MNESEKNIETCLPESILAEVASVPTDPQFVSLVNESLDPLKQQAVQQAGSDAYNEVVASHKPYTFTSQVRQMKSNLILLLRRLWRFPFGIGAVRSLSDMWAHYITRLQGSETYGIPSRLDQLTDLPSAPLLVADRKIVADGVPDGISLIRLLSDSTAANAVTTLTDDNTGWTLNSSKLKALLGLLPKVETVTANGIGQLAQQTIQGNAELKTLNLTGVTSAYSQYSDGDSDAMRSCIMQNPKLEEVYAPSLTDYTCGGNGNQYNALISGCHALKKVTLGKVANNNYPGWGGSKWVIQYCEALEELHVAGVVETNCLVRSGQNANLILLEFTAEQTNSANLAWWSPTLDSSNLQQFLQNFRSFIVLRLANRKTTTALTLTLSAAVYNAVTGANSGWASQHTLAELGITDNDLTDLETELGITSATIYASWLDTYTGANGIHWDINKAN